MEDLVATTWNTIIDRGLPWYKRIVVQINGTPVNLTGYDVTVTIGSIELSEGSGVTLDHVDGVVEIRLTDEQTESLRKGNTRLHVDMVSGGGVALPRGIATATVR